MCRGHIPDMAERSSLWGESFHKQRRERKKMTCALHGCTGSAGLKVVKEDVFVCVCLCVRG